jgi:hypothetical protein
MIDEPQVDDDQLVYSSAICSDYGVTDRALRQWIALDKFPPPDGNLHGRIFWFMRTVRAHKADVVAGRYRQARRPNPSAHKAA